MPARAPADPALAVLALDLLERLYPDATCELDFRTPYQLLVAVVLSAQTTDAAVNKCTPALFARFPDARSQARAEPGEVEPFIRTIGLFRSKARHLVALSRQIVERHGGEVPGSMEALIALPGVGRKTANVVLSHAFGVPAIAVDTHVGRLARRLGWTRAEDPRAVEEDLMALLPRERWSHGHHLLIWHGRRCCTARAPACGRCPLAEICPSAFLVGAP
ncbi:endonuclease III [Myxococcota bacterium]|nr:endonuclease III [Myxococcota bacterium]